MKALNNEEIKNELRTVRLQIVELKNELEWIAGSTVPKGEVYEQFCRVIDRHAEEFTFNPNNTDIFRVNGIAQPYNTTEANLGPLLCGLFGNEIKKSIKSKIDALDYEAGPPVGERPELVKDIEARVFKLEQRQEELIVMGEHIGMHVSRPAGFDPMAVLGFSK